MKPYEGRVEVEEGVSFGRGGERALHCDVYRPPPSAPASRRRSVLLVHGGGWQQGDRSQLRGYGISLARLGYVGVACEYRLTGEAVWPAQIHDVKTALRFMRAEQAALGIDPDKIAVSGNSAGAHLALVAGATPDHPELEGEGGHAGAGTGCAAVIAIYAPTLLRPTLQLEGPIEKLFGPDPEEALVALASPAEHARPDFPPTQLIHGSGDDVVPIRSSFLMYEALDAAGAPVELHTFRGAPHAFDTDPALGRQCAQLMALFLERHVPA